MKRKQKSLVALLLVVACAVFMTTACGKSESEPSSSTAKDTSLSDVMDRGVLNVAAEGNWTPYVYKDPKSGKLVGFEVEVAKEIGKRLGVKVKEVPADSWDSAMAGLDNGMYDVLICGAGPTPERKKIYEVGKPYGEQVIGLAVAKDNDSIKDWKDLKGKTSANSLSSSSGKIARKYGADLVEASLDEGMNLIKRGDADCTVNDVYALNQYIKANPNCGIEVRLIYKPDHAYEIQSAPLLPKGSKALCNKIDEITQEMIKDGTCYKLCKKYFGKDFADNVTLYK